jgi:lysyl-tRNA synthetase class I
MSLVNLADEYERLVIRNFEQELNEENLSRRKKVQIEDAMGALVMSKVTPESILESSDVTFRHLCLLAQTKTSDEMIWESLGYSESKKPPNSLVDRLNKMKLWIKSQHLPEEMRIALIDNPKSESFEEFGEEEIKVLKLLKHELETCEWNKEEIGNAIPNSAKSVDLSPRIAYFVAYTTLMGRSRGPRLAPILAEIERSRIIKILEQCLTVINS